MARKLLEGTVAENVLKHGTGAINVDGCRVGTGGYDAPGDRGHESNRNRASGYALTAGKSNASGRWPANLIHDGSDEVVGLFPVNRGKAAPPRTFCRTSDTTGWSGGSKAMEVAGVDRGDTGSAARFFYCAKASKADRDEGLTRPAVAAAAMQGNQISGQRLGGDGKPIQTPTRRNHHPTVKPTELMRYLCRLVTPPGGIVLDPFMGSGSTGKAAVLEGFRFVGVEREAEYLDIAAARIEAAMDETPLFQEADA